MKNALLFAMTAALVQPAVAATAPKNGEHIILLGNGLGERFLDHPYFEADLQMRFPEKQLVVRNLCRSMGGDVRFRANEGAGSTFTVELPAAD